MLTGLSFSALSVSKDVELRKYIKNYATENSNLFGNIGMAEAESDLSKKVTYFTKRSEKLRSEENEIEVSLSDDEIKQYIAFIVLNSIFIALFSFVFLVFNATASYRCTIFFCIPSYHATGTNYVM